MADGDLPGAHPLRHAVRPDFEVGDRTVASADLFGGCGGLTLGIAQACHENGVALDVRLAVDFDEDASSVYTTNFPKANVRNSDVRELFDRDLGESLSDAEQETKEKAGAIQLLVAGPPCQGHSDLNNHTRRVDPKNGLYLRVARAADVLEPVVVFIENVPAVRHDRGRVVNRTISHLEALGFKVAHQVVHLDALGIPQRRRRHVLLAARSEAPIDPVDVLSDLVLNGDQLKRDLRWAIGDLANIESGVGIDQAPRASRDNAERMEWLLTNDKYDLPNERRPVCHQNEEHTYISMYGRLKWDAPAQTITSGFGSIGQGRYMHPDKCRALTPHEAARIQGFPDYFQFSPLPARDALATMIGNAVPPELARRAFASVVPLLVSEVAAEDGVRGD
jgi:DNA (cytosine-5)-methyltransferase 1